MEKWIITYVEVMLMAPFVVLPVIFFKEVGPWILLLLIPVPLFVMILVSIWRSE